LGEIELFSLDGTGKVESSGDKSVYQFHLGFPSDQEHHNINDERTKLKNKDRKKNDPNFHGTYTHVSFQIPTIFFSLLLRLIWRLIGG
jgi:hypothetical protein